MNVDFAYNSRILWFLFLDKTMLSIGTRVVNSCRPYTESKCITFLTTLKTWKSIVLLFSVNVSWLKGLRETGGCVEKNGYYVRARESGGL